MAREMLRRYGIQPEKVRGQHFLADDDTLDFMVRMAELDENDVVLEAGAGVGNLTEKLIPHCNKVIAVETDRRFVNVLQQRFNDADVDVLHGDVMQIDVPLFDRCVSNIPYQISSPFTEFLATRKAFSIVMYQRAFADRLIAEPGSGDYARISILAQFYFTLQPLLQVDRNAFYPQPDVDSTLMRLRPRETLPDVNEEHFFRVTKALFTHKRKKVKNALSDSFHILEADREDIEALDLPHAHERVINLGVDDIVDMTEAMRTIL